MSNQEMPLIGGQAVIEGVMMKAPDSYCISVRKSDGTIKSKVEHLKGRQHKILKLPIIRGFIAMIDMLVLGLKSLQWSADQFDEQETPMTWKEYALLIAFSMGFAICLFIVLPLFLTRYLTESQGFVFNMIDGLLRITIFVIYLVVIGLLDDVKTLFKYHGAEHKAVNCYESGQELTVANARKFTTAHPRCGTSFILIVLVLSIALFSLVTSEHWYVKFAVRIVFIPVIAGISYEVLHYSAKHRENKVLRALITPGLWLQKLTTKEPDDKQLEVALASIKSVIVTRIQ